MSKPIRCPNKTLREIFTAICIFLIAASCAVVGAVKNNYRWIGLGVIGLCIVVIAILWITYAKQKKTFSEYSKQNAQNENETVIVPQTKHEGITKNFLWVFDVPKLLGSPIQFADDEKLKSAIECIESARNDINYVKSFDTYKDIELNNINMYIRQVLEWALKFIKFNDTNFKKWKTYFTIFDGKKISFDTDFVIDENRNMTSQWNITSHQNGIYTYTAKFQTGKMFYAQSYNKIVGKAAITKWNRDDTTGAIFLSKWAKMYPSDHIVALIQDVCLDIYRTTSKVIHASEETRKTINLVYSKYYKDENVSEKAKALLVAKAMFHQTRYVLWYVANKYSLYDKPFENTDSSVYESK